jgi:hypothetical protein
LNSAAEDENPVPPDADTRLDPRHEHEDRQEEEEGSGRVAVAEAEPGAGREDEDEDDDATIGRDEEEQQQGRPLDREIWIAGCCCCSMLIKTLLRFAGCVRLFIICSFAALAAVVNGNNDARIRACMVRARLVEISSRVWGGWGCAFLCLLARVRVHRCSWRRRTGAGSSVAERCGARDIFFLTNLFILNGF